MKGFRLHVVRKTADVRSSDRFSIGARFILRSIGWTADTCQANRFSEQIRGKRPKWLQFRAGQLDRLQNWNAVKSDYDAIMMMMMITYWCAAWKRFDSIRCRQSSGCVVLTPARGCSPCLDSASTINLIWLMSTRNEQTSRRVCLPSLWNELRSKGRERERRAIKWQLAFCFFWMRRRVEEFVSFLTVPMANHFGVCAMCVCVCVCLSYVNIR